MLCAVICVKRHKDRYGCGAIQINVLLLLLFYPPGVTAGLLAPPWFKRFNIQLARSDSVTIVCHGLPFPVARRRC